ncbi:MAG: aldo/keto reductase, partial [Bacteroidota bacterium]
IIPGMRKKRNVLANTATSDGKGLSEALYHELKNHRWDRKPTSWSQ